MSVNYDADQLIQSQSPKEPFIVIYEADEDDRLLYAVIPGFDQGIIGMTVGEVKELDIPVDEAYGERTLDAVMVVEPTAFPEEMEVSVGMQVQGEGPNGPFPAIVTAIASNGVTIDANHPLAGHSLNFEIELVSINEE